MSSESDVDAAAVERYVATVRSALEDDPSMSARTAELRVTQPLLDVLGWDLHGGAVVAGFETAAGEVGFALRADGRPRALVETVAPGDEMTPADGERLVEAMRAADVDRGLLLDGRELAVLALRDGERDHRRVALSDLPEHRGLLERFTPDALAADERAAAARALADSREAVATDLTDRLLTATEGRCDAPLRRASERFLDQVIRQLGPETRPDSGPSDDPEPNRDRGDAADGGGERSDGDPAAAATTAAADTSDATPGGTERAESPPSSDGPTATDADASATRATRPAETTDTADQDPSDDGEFVVRFFDGSRSVGAVGGSAPLSALLQACKHLQGQRAVFRGLSTPWSPDGVEAPVLTDGPVDAPTRQLPTGHYLRTELNREEIGATVEGLAGEAGLRVMLQGDW